MNKSQPHAKLRHVKMIVLLNPKTAELQGKFMVIYGARTIADGVVWSGKLAGINLSKVGTATGGGYDKAGGALWELLRKFGHTDAPEVLESLMQWFGTKGYKAISVNG